MGECRILNVNPMFRVSAHLVDDAITGDHDNNWVTPTTNPNSRRAIGQISCVRSEQFEPCHFKEPYNNRTKLYIFIYISQFNSITLAFMYFAFIVIELSSACYRRQKPLQTTSLQTPRAPFTKGCSKSPRSGLERLAKSLVTILRIAL